MEFTKKTNIGGDWAKVGEDFKDGDLITILSEGEMVAGDFGERPVFKIKTKNGDKNLGLNQTSINNLIDAFGKESSGWKGKTVKAHVLRQMVNNKLRNICYLAEPSWELTEKGFVHGNTEKEEDINADEIPW